MLTTKEISEMLRVSEETVRRWIRTGELEATQDGKSYQIDQDWLDAFIQKKSVMPGTSLAKMQSLIEGIIGNPNTKGAAADFFSKSLNQFMQNADFFNGQEPKPEPEPEPRREPETKAEDIEARLESLKRQKKKLELEHQLKLLDIEEEIARYETKQRQARNE